MRLAELVLLTAVALSGQAHKAEEPSNADPPLAQSDLQIVHRAWQLLNSPTKWNRADNRECPAHKQTYSLYCALEKATQEITHDFKHRGAVMQQARFVVDEVLAKGNHYEHRLMNYNNDPQTTFADVQKFFSILEQRIKRRLARQSQP
jgi:hypothetical protein